MAKKQKKGLSDVDKFFIEGNREMSADALAEKLGTDDVAGVKEYLDTLPAKELPKAKPEQTQEEREEEVRKSGLKAIDVMQFRDGVTVMTPAASELGDATRKVAPNFEKLNADKIHKINPKKPYNKNPFR